MASKTLSAQNAASVREKRAACCPFGQTGAVYATRPRFSLRNLPLDDRTESILCAARRDPDAIVSRNWSMRRIPMGRIPRTSLSVSGAPSRMLLAPLSPPQLSAACTLPRARSCQLVPPACRCKIAEQAAGDAELHGSRAHNSREAPRWACGSLCSRQARGNRAPALSEQREQWQLAAAAKVLLTATRLKIGGVQQDRVGISRGIPASWLTCGQKRDETMRTDCREGR